MNGKACVIGSGPNGLSAAIVLAQAGMQVKVFEAEAVAGGGVRTMELTLPGFRHDFGSAVYPLGAGSPFFSTLPLTDYGLEWVHSPAPLAHPFDDGTAMVLERDLHEAAIPLGEDGRVWRNLTQPFVERWTDFAAGALRSPLSVPRHPLLMARFGVHALFSARHIAKHFKNERTRALFAGMAAHSFLTLDSTLSGAFGLIMAISAHAVGWPIARGGAQALTDALCRHLEKLGGAITTSAPVESIKQFAAEDLLVFDVSPAQLLHIAGSRLSPSYKSQLERFRRGPGVFKADFALSSPIPWRARECARATTVHIGGSFNEIAASESEMRAGQPAARPFVLLSQPSLFDPTRAPAGKHTAWAYCHIPNGSTVNMLESIENQIERFAPGFRDCVIARRSFSPNELQSMDSNLGGGDISGGDMELAQFLFRPTWRGYATSDPQIYLCSSSTPPGGGVHGMCGYHAAQLALRRMT